MSLKGEIEPKVNVVIQIPFKELTNSRYDQIANAADSLSKRRISFKQEKNGEFMFLTPFPLVESATVDGLRVIEITLLANVIPYFAALGQRYTKYECDIMLSLKSVYAKRMFDIVSKFHNRGQHQFRYLVDELRTILNYPEEHRFNDFVLYALEVSKRQLLEKADIILDWVPIKKAGKKVIELEFSVKTAQQLAAEGVKQDQRMVNKMSINEAVTTAWQLMKNYKLKPWQKDLIASDHSLLETFYRVDSELANGLRTNIKSPTAYLVKSLGIDQMKAPKATKPAPKPAAAPVNTPVSGSVQSISSIMNELFYAK